MVVDLAVAQQHEQAFNFFVRDGPTQAYVVDVGDRNQNGRFIRQDPQMEKPASSTENRLLFNFFDDPETMVRVNDLVTDLKSHVPLVSRCGVWQEWSALSGVTSIAEEVASINGNGRKMARFCRLSRLGDVCCNP